VNFFHDSVHEKLLKSVYFSPSHSKYKKGTFLDTVYIQNK